MFAKHNEYTWEACEQCNQPLSAHFLLVVHEIDGDACDRARTGYPKELRICPTIPQFEANPDA